MGIDRRSRAFVIAVRWVAGPTMGSGDVSQSAHDSVANRDRLDHNDPVAVLREFLGKGFLVPEPHREHVPVVLLAALPGRFDREGAPSQTVARPAADQDRGDALWRFGLDGHHLFTDIGAVRNLDGSRLAVAANGADDSA